MSSLFPLSEKQMARIASYFPLSHGVPRVDDRRVLSGIIHVIRNGMQWLDVQKRIRLRAVRRPIDRMAHPFDAHYHAFTEVDGVFNDEHSHTASFRDLRSAKPEVCDPETASLRLAWGPFIQVTAFGQTGRPPPFVEPRDEGPHHLLLRRPQHLFRSDTERRLPTIDSCPEGAPKPKLRRPGTKSGTSPAEEC